MGYWVLGGLMTPPLNSSFAPAFNSTWYRYQNYFDKNNSGFTIYRNGVVDNLQESLVTAQLAIRYGVINEAGTNAFYFDLVDKDSGHIFTYKKFYFTSYPSVNSWTVRISLYVDDLAEKIDIFSLYIPNRSTVDFDDGVVSELAIYNSFHEEYLHYIHAITPKFNYKPLYNLHSANQNFTLTTIGKTPNDGSAQITAPISDIMAFSEQSRLRAYIQNIKDNDRFVKMFTLNEHKYIGIKIDTYSNGVYEGKIGFYIDGVRQVALDLNFLSNSIFDANNLFPYFLAISVDFDNAACLPTIVYDWSDTGLTDYQCENYTAVSELYEYLHPFFGPVINPENPDIPVIDPTPTTDGETGGDGSWWTPDYEVGVPEIYEYGVADCGFMSLYRMTETQMRNLASYLWSDDFLDNVKKFFNDPMQMIVCARMIPYAPNSAQNTSTIKAGNVDTTCVGYKIDSNNQYTKIDCGQVRVEPRGDTYMDYSPYCSAFIYLPFVGVRPLDVDLIMGHDIGVEYNCDCLTGQSVCFVKIDKNVAYTYECTVGVDIPISSQSYGNVIGALSSALTMPISAGTMLATGGMSAPMMPTMLASASIGISAGTSIAQNTRETISHSGNVTGIGGMLSYKKPILYMEYTNPINAKNQKHFLGAPSHKNLVLKNCSGLTVVKQIFIELDEATDDEKKELSAILESGVIV